MTRRLRKVTVKVGEQEREFTLRSLTEREVQELVRVAENQAKKIEFNARLIAACVCDPGGQQPAHTVQEVLDWDAALTIRLARLCSEHVGLTEEASEEAEKN